MQFIRCFFFVFFFLLDDRQIEFTDAKQRRIISDAVFDAEVIVY